MKNKLLVITLVITTSFLNATNCTPIQKVNFTLSDYEVASIEEKAEYNEILEAIEPEVKNYRQCIREQMMDIKNNPITVMAEAIEENRGKISLQIVKAYEDAKKNGVEVYLPEDRDDYKKEKLKKDKVLIGFVKNFQKEK